MRRWLWIITLLVALVAVGGATASAAPEDATGLTASEIAGLQYMREEEKLARDVYLTLGEQWALPVFKNIARSEQSHMAAVKTLLDRYGVADPALAERGRFQDPTLQALYDRLVSEGQASLAAALRVGVTIEELDIQDLKQRLSQAPQADIKLVYTNLLRGSQNHLRAFTTTLARTAGETVQPQGGLQSDANGVGLGARSRNGRGGWR